MASIQIRTNTGEVIGQIQARLDILANPEYLLRPVCFDLIDLMTQRIHENGIASDGSPLGNYSTGYLKVRQTKEYNRTADPKVRISLTRQLENDWSVIATPRGFGIGFKNKHNFDKSQWVEKIYDRPIFSLSYSEEQYAFKRLNELITKALNPNDPGNSTAT